MTGQRENAGAIQVIVNCSSKCVFCASNKGYLSKEAVGRRASGDYLSTMEKSIRETLNKYKEQGIRIIEISGDDPLDYKNLFSLLDEIRHMGFESVGISTHGKQLADLDFLDRLIGYGVNRFNIPLYGQSAKVHDAITNTEGSFDRVMGGLKNIIQRGINVDVSCLVLEGNKTDLLGIAFLMGELGVKTLNFTMPCITRVDFQGHYIPYSEIGEYVTAVLGSIQGTDLPGRFIDFPPCVFKMQDSERIINEKELGVGSIIYPHRIKVKTEMCQKCDARDSCGGFYQEDVSRFGTGALRPIVYEGFSRQLLM